MLFLGCRRSRARRRKSVCVRFILRRSGAVEALIRANISNGSRWCWGWVAMDVRHGTCLGVIENIEEMQCLLSYYWPSHVIQWGRKYDMLAVFLQLAI